MPRRKNEDKIMKRDKVASFRAPDQEFCDMFNQVMEMTGMNIADLSVLAIRKGLRDAAAEVIKKRDEARKQWDSQFGRRQ